MSTLSIARWSLGRRRSERRQGLVAWRPETLECRRVLAQLVTLADVTSAVDTADFAPGASQASAHASDVAPGPRAAAENGAGMMIGEIQKLVVAGDPDGNPSDSPSNRVDDNTNTSEYGGVGSLFMDLGDGTGYLCTGTVISTQHVLTAGHCVDSNDDGQADFAPSAVTFQLNYGKDASSLIQAAAIDVHPDYTGFAKPAVNDDVVVITLSSPVPAGVPIYALNQTPFVNVETIEMVGYGRSGTGVDGFTTGASLSVKRMGRNEADQFEADDEGTLSREVFRGDFDGPTQSTDFTGDPTLGNADEATIGPGDSGGPAFVRRNGQLEVFGINTFSFRFFAFAGRMGPRSPYFGSGLGGMVVSEYVDFIQSVVNRLPSNNADPTAVDDLAVTTTTEDAAIAIAGSTIVGNDTDTDNDILTVASVDATSALGAAVSVDANGDVHYDPRTSASLNALDDTESKTDSFEYLVSDGKGGTDVGMISLTVTGVNDAPVADAGANQSVTTGETVSLDGTQSSDPEGPVASFNWTLTDPENNVSLLTGSTPTFTAALSGDYVATLVVTDSKGLASAVDSVIISSNPAVAELITITKAAYNAKKQQVSVEATSSLGSAAVLTATLSSGETQGMTYNSRKGVFTATFTVQSQPSSVIVSSDNATATAPIGGGGGGSGNPNRNSSALLSSIAASLATSPNDSASDDVFATNASLLDNQIAASAVETLGQSQDPIWPSAVESLFGSEG